MVESGAQTYMANYSGGSDPVKRLWLPVDRHLGCPYICSNLVLRPRFTTPLKRKTHEHWPRPQLFPVAYSDYGGG